ncbi:helix-turn-helix transcriptional regulator [Salibacterium aidingense]|uniref:helix-turn-helix transcriptional regulator n=1 Tax=Salibacterium aidingense TaxID=384933 RepID=UPI00040706A0|nr:helix-turn-helix transcriptional regulator [Salibacterium aidingense]
MIYQDQNNQEQTPTKPLLLLDTGDYKQKANRFAVSIAYGMTTLNFEKAERLYPKRCILYYIQDTAENIIFHLPHLHQNIWQIIVNLPLEQKPLKKFLLYSHALVYNNTDQQSWLNHLKLAYDLNYYIHPVFHTTVLKEFSCLENGSPISGKREINVNTLKASKYLTRAEVRVLSALAEGKSNQAIADTLGVHENTINNQMAKIHKKLQVTSKMEIIRKCFQCGIFVLTYK